MILSLVSEIITQDQIQDLWGCGFTIVERRRHPDPFFVPSEIIPQGRAYQWWHLVHDKYHFHREGSGSSGWAPVPASRHEGYFMPFGHTGDIEVNGLGLFEKSKTEVDQERLQQVADAKKPLQDWAAKYGDLSGGARMVEFGGGVTVVSDVDTGKDIYTDIERDVLAGPKEKTIETTSAIPRDMVPYIASIFAERDRLIIKTRRPNGSLKPGEVADKFYAAVNADKSLPWWPTLHAILLPIAIANVRKKIVTITPRQVSKRRIKNERHRLRGPAGNSPHTTSRSPEA